MHTPTDLTSKHSAVFENNLLFFKHGLSVLVAAFRVGKITELLSYVVWECLHKLRIYRPDDYVTFNNSEPYFLLDFQGQESNSGVCSDLTEKELLPLKRQPINWKVVYVDDYGVSWGTLFDDDRTLCKTTRISTGTVRVCQFDNPVESIFVASSQVIFICTSGFLYRSVDQGDTFYLSLEFSSSISYFLFNNGMTELPDGTLLLGEYGSVWHGNKWQNLSYLYSTKDAGKTWIKNDFLLRLGINKHVHLVKYSSLLNVVFLTDGDNKKKVWINENMALFNQRRTRKEGGWELINSFHIQTGGYTSMVEGSSSILFGTDYLGGTNFIVRTKDDKLYKKKVIKDPYRRSPVMNMVVRKTPQGDEIWAVLHNSISSKTRCLLMCSKDEGNTWDKVIEYDGTRYEIRIVSSSRTPMNKLFIAVIAKVADGYQNVVYALT